MSNSGAIEDFVIIFGTKFEDIFVYNSTELSLYQTILIFAIFILGMSYEKELRRSGVQMFI